MIAEFAHAELYPGKATTLKIHAEAGSLCAIGVVDKSVHLLGGPHRLTLENVCTDLVYDSYNNSMYC